MADEKPRNSIDALLQETREFAPSDEFRRNANISDPNIWAKARRDREAFWEGFAAELEWERKWDKVLDEKGNPVEVGGEYLAITDPWPSMLRGIYGDPERYAKQYWSKWDGIYFTGDGAKRDEEGYFWLLGRVDDVMNVAGHRIGTMEVDEEA